MITPYKFPTLIAAVAVFFACSPVSAEQFSGNQKSEIERIIHDYLLENPEVVEEALQNLEKKRVEEERLAAVSTIKENFDVLFQSDRDMVLGNPEGDITMVEFFDYNCGYCKRALIDILQLLEQDSNLRLVLKEFPVLGKESLEAAQVSVAASRVDSSKFSEFHQKLLLDQGRATRESALSLATEMGYDSTAIQAEMENPEIVSTIQSSYEIAGKLKINGTPSFVIGEEVVKGAIPVDRMQEIIKLIRSRKTAVSD